MSRSVTRPSLTKALNCARQVNLDILTKSSLSSSIAMWEKELSSDYDKDFVLSGIAQGCHIVPDHTLVGRVDCKNYSSALTNKAETSLTALFTEELAEGKLSLQAEKPHGVHSIGAVLKKGQNGFRPINDCSRPYDDPLNGYMEPENFSLESFDSAIDQSSPGCFLRWSI